MCLRCPFHRVQIKVPYKPFNAGASIFDGLLALILLFAEKVKNFRGKVPLKLTSLHTASDAKN